MKKLVFLALIIGLLSSCNKPSAEPRMIDVKRFFIAYGIEGGVFQGSMNMRPEDYDSVIYGFYLDADWFYQCSPNKKWIDENVLKDELPANKEGALRVLSLKLFRIAEGHGNIDKYNFSLNHLRQEEAKEYTSENEGCKYTHKPIIINDNEIQEYYKAAIWNKIKIIQVKLLTVDEQKKAKELLHVYCIDPVEKNIKGLRNFKKPLGSKEKEDAFIRVIKELSPVIASMILEY